MKLRELFETWYEPLKLFLNSQQFISIGKQIARDRHNYEIIPKRDSDIMFKVFRVTPYESVKVVILGQDPYYNPIDAFDGLAFSNSTLLNAQPSLRNILKEVETDIYDSFDLSTIGDLNLTRWAKQGVLLINTAMSVKQHLSNSHTELWRPFTAAVIKALNKRNDIVWILWGRKAQNYKILIRNPSHTVLESAHPSPLGCNYEAPIKFIGSKPFSKCNEQLEARNIKPIIW